MPQQTNFNVSPYFDDFDEDKGYHKVLFKPGVPLQARELTTLQSILQNQIERFGSHVFKEGSPVLDGQIGNDIVFPAIQVESEYNGLPISLYFNQLVDKKIKGQTSGIVAIVRYALNSVESERGVHTLYLQYISNGESNFNSQNFLDGETLLAEETISYGNGFTIPQGQGICNAIATNASTSGSSISIKEGIFFVRGIFAKAQEQRIILDQYGITPSFKVGFTIIERIVTADEDESLYDNAQGFSNYAASGSDRFQLELKLDKRSINETDLENFVTLYSIFDGVPQFKITKTQYNVIRDELARRTADQSGDFYVKPFTVNPRDTLNDRLVNTTGIYYDGQITVDGNTPSDDLMTFEIGSGKAYVNGYEVESVNQQFVDVEKPRTLAPLENQAISFNAGTQFLVNNVYGVPSVGLGTTAFVSLMDSRLGTNKSVAAGTTIGFARIYDFIPSVGYVDDSSQLNLRLFDLQTFTKIGLTTTITQSTPAYIEGKKSGAAAYLKDSVSGVHTMTLYNVYGQFIPNEQIIINGIENGRLIKTITDFDISNIKSIHATKVGVATFNADMLLSKQSNLAAPSTTFKITAASGGISTISAGLGTNFSNFLFSGDIIKYGNPSLGGLAIFNKVETVSAGGTNFTVSAVSNVTNVCVGSLPTSEISVNDLKVIRGSVGSPDSSLLTELSRNNVKSFYVTNSSITQRRIFQNQSFAANSLTLTITDADIIFDAFDEDRFVIAYTDGSIEPLNETQYTLDATGKILTFNGLSKVSGNADVIVTVKNLKPNSKIKKFNSVGSLVVNFSKYTASGIGTTTLNDGLTYSQVYGVRVQDEEICLNVPDVVKVLGVFESQSTADPQLPRLTLNSFSGPTANNQDFVIGEHILGKSSGAMALVVNRVDTDKLEYVYLNASTFDVGEIIVGKDSSINANIVSITLSDQNVSNKFGFDDGQRDSFYDYSRLVKNKNAEEPKGKLKIIYQYYTIDSSDTGEFITATSYSDKDFKYNIPEYNNTRLTDFVDIRPRVPVYTLSSKSPFEFASRTFTSPGQYSEYTLAPGENLTASFSYYLPRVDRIILNPDGNFQIVKGTPSDTPEPPLNKTGTLDVAIVGMPGYLHNVVNAKVDLIAHKRYQMQDIASLEERIRRVEEFTSLSALESKMAAMTVKDAATGLDQFKCGIFADSFTNLNSVDEASKISHDSATSTIRPPQFTTKIDLQLGSELISGFTDTFSPNADAKFATKVGPGMKKTGNLVTLDYTEVEYKKQILASRSENVTAFLISFWQGTLKLQPTVDKSDAPIISADKSVTVTNPTKTLAKPDDVEETITTTKEYTQDKVVYSEEPAPVYTASTPKDYTQNLKDAYNYKKAALVNYGKKEVKKTKKVKGQPVTTTKLVNNGSYLSGTTKNGKTKITIKSLMKYGEEKAKEDLQKFLPQDKIEEFVGALKKKKSGTGHFFFTPGEVEKTYDQTVKVTSKAGEVITGKEILSIQEFPEKLGQESESTTNDEITEGNYKYLVSRNVEFDTNGLKPVTQHYPFLSTVEMGKYVIPKLLEVTMSGNAAFQVGETVESDVFGNTNVNIKFRLCTPGHKNGPYNAPTESYKLVPYTQQPPETTYSTASTVLYIDTFALQDQKNTPEFKGYVAKDMTLTGKTSGAKAKITDIRLISDSVGTLQGSLFIPNPEKPENPAFSAGENKFFLTDVPLLSIPPGTLNAGGTYLNQSTADAVYTGASIQKTITKVTTTTITPTITPSFKKTIFQPTKTNVNVTTIQKQLYEKYTQTYQYQISGQLPKIGLTSSDSLAKCPYDPIAQTFFVSEKSGIFLTSLEVFFKTKPDFTSQTADTVTLQIRTVENGSPTSTTLPYSEVTLAPDKINLSTNGSVATKFTFASPVYLDGPKEKVIVGAEKGSESFAEYSIVLLSNSKEYEVFIARLGENDLQTNTKISVKAGDENMLGSLFKSQNGYTWSPSQLDDLKFTLYKAQFITEGTCTFFNPELNIGNKTKPILPANSLIPLSKKITVGLGSTGYSPTIIVPGITLAQGGARGKLAGIGGSITVGAGVTVSNSGVGYTNGTFTDVNLITETGVGQGAQATVIVAANKINTVTITNGGIGYVIGDSLQIPDIGQNVGFGGQVAVTSIATNNTFIIDGVQGQFSAGIALSYVDSSGAVAALGAGVTISSISNDPYYDGLHMKIIQPNHGMHSVSNFVEIKGMRPLNTDLNSTLTAELTATETTTIELASGTGFNLFEGIAVSAINPGFVIIGNEVIRYTTVSGNSLTGLTRAIDGTQANTYPVNTKVYRYQFNGFSLRRLNKVHSFGEVDTANHPIDLNSYSIKVDADGTDFANVGIGSDRTNDLYFTATGQTGSTGVEVSNNIQFESIKPNINGFVVPNTDLSAKLRTFSATSIGGNEVSFEDQGFIDLDLNDVTYFETPRLIASNINASNYLTNVPGNRSLAVQMLFSSSDSNVSPFIDTENITYVQLASNLINNPIEFSNPLSYALDNNVRSLTKDKHSTVLVTKPVKMKLPANALSVVLTASKSTSSDFRVLYRLFRVDAPELSQNFELFPGHSNSTIDGIGNKVVINPSLNDGTPDLKPIVSDDLSPLSYSYSVENLPDFDAFSIKVVMAAKNQANPPIIGSLSAIATTKPKV